MFLWLMRHGEAVDPDQTSTDAARWLTNKGRNQVSALGRWLKERATPPDFVFHSPFVRTTQTAELLGENWGLSAEGVQPRSCLQPGMRAQDILQVMKERACHSVVCISHQPNVGQALQELVGTARIDYAPGTIACIEFGGPLSLGGGHLVGLLAPDWFS